MPLNLSPFADVALTSDLLAALITDHERAVKPRLETFFRYFRNPIEPAPAGSSGGSGGRGYRLAQERGLPARLTGFVERSAANHQRLRREVVIENDIGWRIQAMVDFLFSRPVKLISRAADPATAAAIERILDAVWERSGGASLLADIGLLGHVYGHVDLLVRSAAPAPAPESGANEPESDPPAPTTTPRSLDALAAAAADLVSVEVTEPTRAIPLLAPGDYRTLDAFILHYTRAARTLTATPPPNSRSAAPTSTRATETITELFGPHAHQIYLDSGDGPQLIVSEANHVSPGTPPVVHIQNVSQPFAYSGVSEVEPLLPLQDELNIRLSERAFRVTMQSFKMYLAKGLDGFDSRPVGPGQMWCTDNPDAAIEAFGGEGSSPSEQAHIDELRQAFDKQSSLPPLATGVVQAKVGNLSSENALRLTLQGVLTRTARKQLAYGRGIASASTLILAALDHAGLFNTSPHDRLVRVEWPDPLPAAPSAAAASARPATPLAPTTDEGVI